jgi:hypothetical protein
VLERTWGLPESGSGREPRQYAVRHLERFPPGTPYAEVGERVKALFAAAPLAGGTLVLDQTAVGELLLSQRIGLTRTQPVT